MIKLLLNMCLILFIVGCVSNPSEDESNANAFENKYEIIVVDGYITKSIVKDSSGQIAIENMANPGRYYFDYEPLYPIFTQGGFFVDTNQSFDLNMSSHIDGNSVITPITTIIKDDLELQNMILYSIPELNFDSLYQDYMKNNNLNVTKLSQLFYSFLNDSKSSNKIKEYLKSQNNDLDSLSTFIAKSKEIIENNANSNIKSDLLSVIEVLENYNSDVHDIEVSLSSIKKSIQKSKKLSEEEVPEKLEKEKFEEKRKNNLNTIKETLVFKNLKISNRIKEYVASSKENLDLEIDNEMYEKNNLNNIIEEHNNEEEKLNNLKIKYQEILQVRNSTKEDYEKYKSYYQPAKTESVQKSKVVSYEEDKKVTDVLETEINCSWWDGLCHLKRYVFTPVVKFVKEIFYKTVYFFETIDSQAIGSLEELSNKFNIFKHAQALVDLISNQISNIEKIIDNPEKSFETIGKDILTKAQNIIKLDKITNALLDIDYTMYTYLNPNWMSKIDDNKKISSLLIPGTHDSSAWNTNSPFAKTQDLTIKEQLYSGIRYLDIRLSDNIFNDYSFELKHGIINLGDFKALVMDDIEDFLKLYPNETIFVSLKQEEGDLDLNKLSSEFIYNDDYSFYRDNINSYSILGELRGKIILIDRLDYFYNLGISWSLLNIQDKYEIDCLKFILYHVCVDFDYNKKWNHVKSLINTASNDRNGIYFNALNANSNAQGIYRISHEIHKNFLNYIKKYDFNHGMIISKDFPNRTDDLIKTIIEKNTD